MEHLNISKADGRFGWAVLLVAFAVLCIASFAPSALGWW